MEHVKNAASEITWFPEQHLAVVRYAQGATLTAEDGNFLVSALSDWVGDAPFGVLADAKGLAGTDAQYRKKSGDFFKKHNQRAFIALTNMGAVIRVVVEMFRIGTGVQLKAFANEEDAREWLRSVGITA